MIRTIRFLAKQAIGRDIYVGMFAAIAAVCWLGTASMLHAQQPNVHFLHHGAMPPGAIGSQQLQRGGPLPGFYQPVEIKAPAGALISLAVENQFDQPAGESRKAGMLIGAVYRLKITNIPMAAGMEVFPTIEVIDRIYAPPGQEVRFAIPIELTEADLKLAMSGKFVTRVIYLEDPRRATPSQGGLPGQNWFEAAPGQDPLAVADGLGRPVAILRMGARLPDQGMDAHFFYGSPPFVNIAARPEVNVLPPPPGTPASRSGNSNADVSAAAGSLPHSSEANFSPVERTR